ncbi:MAG: hypothetical protein P1U88_14890 [Thalassobaculaceae bacterium]|nr:hypothetical protein [Thalassobaculaceae bacterium]
MPPLDPVAQTAVQRALADRRAQRTTQAQAWFRLAACAAPGDTRVVTLVIGGSAQDQARWCLRTACLDPVLTPVLELGGRALAEVGDGGRAISFLRRALVADPQKTRDAAFAMADVLARAGRLSGAYPLAWWAAVNAPGNAAAQVRLAAVAGQIGRKGTAATASLAAARLLPAVTDLSVTAVQSARRAGLRREAWICARRAALVAPQSGDVTYLLTEGGTRPEGMASARVWSRRAVATAPLSAPAWDAVARTLRAEGWFSASLSAARHGLVAVPDDLGCARSMAQAAISEMRFAVTRRVARTARMAHPGDGELAYQLAQAEKANGDLGRGWDLDALRTVGPRFHRTTGLPPRASRKDLPPGHLLVAAEQGIGDELLFLSCLPDLLAECPEPVVEADPRFHSLLSRSFPGLSLIDRQVRVDGEGAIYDYNRVVSDLGLTTHIHAGDLPGRYRRDRDRPTERSGYLLPDPVRVAEWRGRLAELPGSGPLVGLCWRSMLRSGIRSAFYAELPEMLPILRLPGYRFVCLQYDECDAELEALRRDQGIDIWRPRDLDQREDLDGVAALIAALDGAVSTATSVCVLAAAVGCQTIRLAPSLYNITDGRDFFFANMTPTLRRDEPMDVSVAIARAADLLATRVKARK